MSEQTNFSLFSGHLRGGAVWCSSCGYVHVRCSGLAKSADWIIGFVCRTCAETGLTQHVAQLTIQDEHTGLSQQLAQLTVLDGYDPACAAGEAEVAIEEVTLPADEAEVMFTAEVTLPARETDVMLPTDGAEVTLNAQWGQLKGTEISKAVTRAYYKTARWKRNIFYLPTGQVGQSFIEEVTKVIQKFNSDSALAPVALMMLTIMFPLLLQKPSAKSKTADHIKYLDRRLTYWREGRLVELISEGTAIQNRMSQKKKKPKPASSEQRFIRLMEEGKISAALRCIGSLQCGVHQITPEVLAQLHEKHPAPREIKPESLIQGEPRAVENVIYENIDADAIYQAAKKVNGAAGPSGADSDMWKRLLCSKQHKKKPAELCQAVADLAKKLNRERIPASHLQSFVAGRLIPLDKDPGIRPIGIGEVLRRIISSATVTLLKPDLIAVTAPLQTCAGLRGGIEAAIHAMRRMFEDEETEAILLVDASNAFNALNRKAALHNIQYTCPELSTFLHNLYQGEAELFLPNSEEIIYSREGTTQGGPESMAFYAVSTTSLLKSKHADSAKRVFYADDGNGVSKLIKLSEWWKELQVIGPPLGYDPNPSKSILITKPAYIEQARNLFPDILPKTSLPTGVKS